MSNKIEWDKLTVNQYKICMQAMLITSDKYLDKAIVEIYKLQTDEEKYKGQSVEENNLGFSKVDAEVLSKIARKLIEGKELTAGERARARNKMLKYWRQLLYLSRIKWKKEREIRQKQIPLKIYNTFNGFEC